MFRSLYKALITCVFFCWNEAAQGELSQVRLPPKTLIHSAHTKGKNEFTNDLY